MTAENYLIGNLPTGVLAIILLIDWIRERRKGRTAVEASLVAQIRVMSAAHEALLVTNTAMSRRFDEMETLRAKERRERDTEREVEEKLSCERDAKIDLQGKSIDALTTMTHRQEAQIETLQQEVKARDARIAELEKKLNEREKKLDERDARITELERKAGELKGERELLLVKVAELNTKVEELQKRGTGPLAETKAPAPETTADASATVASEESI